MAHKRHGSHDTEATLTDIVAGLGETNPDTPDEKTAEEARYLQGEAARAKKLENDGHELDLTQRKEYANKIYMLIVVWLLTLVSVLLLQGFGKAVGFSLSDSVLLAFIGGTTVNVLGIFVIVAKYIFRISPR